MKICMLLHKSSEYDSRLRREAGSLLRAGHRVDVVELAPGDPAPRTAPGGYRVVSAQPPGWVKRVLRLRLYRIVFGLMIIGRARRLHPDVVHAHDAAMLAPAWVVARLAGARLVYDTHELATGVPYRSRGWALLVRGVERALIRRCDLVITVSGGIARRLQAMYGLRRPPVVLRNLPDLGIESPVPTGALRRRLGLGDEKLVLHQGAPARDRGCETLIRALVRLDRAQLAFLGKGEEVYVHGLRALAEAEGVARRVHFLPSVPFEDLLQLTAEADVGVSLLEDNCENHRLALPNKLFEYVAARIPVVASDLPELGGLVRERGLGELADPADPGSVAEAIRRALSNAAASGSKLEQAATELRWEHEEQKLTCAYAELGLGWRQGRRSRR